MSAINLHTSVDDLRSTFGCSISQYSVDDFSNAIQKEYAGLNRSTVIKLLERAKRMRSQGAHKI